MDINDLPPMPSSEDEEAPKSKNSYLTQTAFNVGPSAINFGKGIVDAVIHPIDTAKTMTELATGTVQHLLPKGLQAESAIGQRELASQVGQFYKDRYGSVDKALIAFRDDPVGVLADVSTVLTGGGAAATKIPGLAKAGAVVKKAGETVAPTALAGKAIAPVAKGLGNAAASLAGVSTRTSAEALKQAAASGLQGGKIGEAFRANMRGGVPQSEVLDQAKNAVELLRQQKSTAYKQDMRGVTTNTAQLQFKPIHDAVDRVFSTGRYKDKVLYKSVEPVHADIKKLVDDWEASAYPRQKGTGVKLRDPDFDTIAGFDALKKSIGEVIETTEPHTAARRVAGEVYHAVKKEIERQDPQYAKIMKDYDTATELIREIEGAFSLGQKGKATANAALGKLQSLMTRSGKRGMKSELTDVLEQSGHAKRLKPALAGQAMSDWAPGGSLGSLMVPAGLAGWATNPAGAATAAAAQSPRLMGELAHGAGRLARHPAAAARGAHGAIGKRIDPNILANILYELEQPKKRGQ